MYSSVTVICIWVHDTGTIAKLTTTLELFLLSYTTWGGREDVVSAADAEEHSPFVLAFEKTYLGTTSFNLYQVYYSNASFKSVNYSTVCMHNKINTINTAHFGCLKSTSVMVSTPFDASLIFNTPSSCIAERNLESCEETKISGYLCMYTYQ